MAKKNSSQKSLEPKILFVEDELVLVDMFRQYFTQHGYTFLNTKDIAEALKITEAEKPDIVLLDIIIPREKADGTTDIMAAQGYDYLRAAKKNPAIKDIPVLMFTNLDTVEDRRRSKELGAAGFIFKNGAEPNEILKMIEGAIKKK